MKTSCPKNVSRPLAAALVVFTCLTASAQEYRVLHHFTGGTNDGSSPIESVVRAGSTLYGMAWGGGTSNLGCIYQINPDGTGFQVLHSFNGGAADGQGPIGSLLLSGTNFYGMTKCENTSYGGTVFKLNTNGSGFEVLRRFTQTNGMWPYGSLIQSGPVLFGFNTYGGSASGWSGKGTVFRMNTDGSDFQALRTFAGGSSDGQGPHGSPILCGDYLYGTTLYGGTNNRGNVFRIGTNGTGFQLLHSFAGGATDGAYPYLVTLVQSGTTLFGTTGGGGTANNGTIFRIETNGAGFQLLHSFAVTNGAGPRSSLVVSGSWLYGATRDGGTNDYGTLYQINTNGTGFRVLHRFDGTNGSKPYGTLLFSDSALYGTTSEGGSNNLGVIYAIDLPVPALAISRSGTNVNLSWNTNCPDYTLESTGHLTNAWTPVPGVTGYSATLPLGPVTNQFFRLRK